MRWKWKIAFKYRSSKGLFQQQMECPLIKSIGSTIALIVNVLACLFVCLFFLFVAVFVFIRLFLLVWGRELLPERGWQTTGLGHGVYNIRRFTFVDYSLCPVRPTLKCCFSYDVYIERGNLLSQCLPLNSAGHTQLKSFFSYKATQLPPFWHGSLEQGDYGNK